MTRVFNGNRTFTALVLFTLCDVVRSSDKIYVALSLTKLDLYVRTTKGPPELELFLAMEATLSCL